MEEWIVETKGLKKYYKLGDNTVKALDGVDFRVKEQEFVAIIGKSGSGKSTLLHMVGGLDTPTEGDVIVAGRSLNGLTKEELAIFRRRKVGFIFQNYNLVPDLNIYENIVLPIELDGKRIDRVFVEELLDVLKLTEKREAFPGNLSGGQQQRVAIARAMIKNPRLLLCDELTGALDTKSSGQVLQFVEKMNRQFGTTVVIITHNEAIAGMADRIIRLKDGQICENRGNEWKIPAAKLVL